MSGGIKPMKAAKLKKKIEQKLRFLPKDVARIIMHLVTVRNRTFRQAEKRKTSDYTEWDEASDHPTAYYPDFPPRIYPQRYFVREEADPDRCKKKKLMKVKYSLKV